MIAFIAFSLRTNFPSTNRIIVVYAYRAEVARSPLTVLASELDSTSPSCIHEFQQLSIPLKAHIKNLIPNSDLDMIIENEDTLQEEHESEVLEWVMRIE